MFKRLETDHESDRRVVRLRFEHQEILASPGDSVAAALLSASVPRFRDAAISGEPRAPYCMMGVCFECLVEIDGIANQQACLVTVREGMAVRRQRGARDIR
ncbi:(2Fe-2S)-binding protein [Microvirga brassicacearum]|uniref:(2Fe-2S)-binding protein n=1 Tax=Microvirga brassicacearum TaxID=2580413 RepID=A0A5N3PC04_9HYPH|nr:(2Fe-2S)-binding protein [Microvirga brassicacearum]KAB0267224.1 (2Fe-2S)-binding protein [Microvirga brassicacearum]